MELLDAMIGGKRSGMSYTLRLKPFSLEMTYTTSAHIQWVKVSRMLISFRTYQMRC